MPPQHIVEKIYSYIYDNKTVTNLPPPQIWTQNFCGCHRSLSSAAIPPRMIPRPPALCINNSGFLCSFTIHVSLNNPRSVLVLTVRRNPILLPLAPFLRGSPLMYRPLVHSFSLLYRLYYSTLCTWPFPDPLMRMVPASSQKCCCPCACARAHPELLLTLALLTFGATFLYCWAVLCTVGCLATSPVFPLWMPVVPPPLGQNLKKYGLYQNPNPAFSVLFQHTAASCHHSHPVSRI